MFYVYIITNSNNRVLYVGVTNNLIKRMNDHKNKTVQGFSKKYNLQKLVYYEEAEEAYSAISREKQIKGWIRKKKNELIETVNPDWEDLYNKIVLEKF